MMRMIFHPLSQSQSQSLGELSVKQKANGIPVSLVIFSQVSNIFFSDKDHIKQLEVQVKQLKTKSKKKQ